MTEGVSDVSRTGNEEIEKCLDEGLEPTYYFSIFTFFLPKYGLFLHEIVECYDFEPHS